MRRPKKKSPPKIKLALDLTAGTPEDIWNDYFTKRSPKLKEVSSIIFQLHSAKKYKHVIAAIQSAIIHGQSQPWMYEVLTVTLKLDKRPQSEIERAAFSKIDFTSADLPSMLYAAANLSRLDSDSLALRIYRQASEIEPTRPEPYVMGLKIAQKLNDHKGIEWAAAGILTNAWTRDHQQLHKGSRRCRSTSRKRTACQWKERRSQSVTSVHQGSQTT